MASTDSPMQLKEKTKAVILELLRQSTGNGITGKTKLFKAFYFAHLYFAQQTDRQGYLSTWPIVRMDNGPGIERFSDLMKELEADGLVQVSIEFVGPFSTSRYEARDMETKGLNANEIAAIRKAAQFVAKKTGSQLSDITHEFSRTWNLVNSDEEMPIYVDLLTDEEVEQVDVHELIAAWRGRLQAQRGQTVKFEDVWRGGNPAHSPG